MVPERKQEKNPKGTTAKGMIAERGRRLALTLVAYSILANLKAMPRLLKSTETSAQVSSKGARRSSPPSASIPHASSLNASVTTVSGVSIPCK